MLHARSVELLHPSNGRRVRFEAPLPAEFSGWLRRGDLGPSIYDDGEALDRALFRAVEARWGLGREDAGPRATTAVRLINEGGDALPGLAVDVYGDWLVAQIQDDGPLGDRAREGRVLDRLHALGFDGIYLKRRPKHASTLVDTRREEVAPLLPLRGTVAPDPLVIREEGIPFVVRLGDGLSTGIFLDQRGNRRRVRELAQGKSVLNLFSYTCAFTVAAAIGGANKTVSVDASAVALERGRENLGQVGLLSGAHTFVAEDAFSWLARAGKKGDRFDLVLLDPPSYSTTKKRRFSAESDYAELASAALAVVRPGGLLLACTNHRGIGKAKFRRLMFDAARAVKRDLSQVKDLPDPADFPPPVGSECHLKSVLVTAV
jgi:23S rRNA (cytosine1962-C5)-methyltransferase